MIEIYFVMMLTLSGQPFDPYIERMPTLEACTAKVALTIKEMADTDEALTFAAACKIVKPQTPPA